MIDLMTKRCSREMHCMILFLLTMSLKQKVKELENKLKKINMRKMPRREL